MTACKYWDAGWCYASKDVSTNARQGGCFEPEYCPYLISQIPVQYETPMTEIEELKAQIKVLEKKLSFLEELEKTKTPVKEAYKRVYGNYPITDIADTCWDNSTWTNFEQGYIAAKKDYKVGEYQEPEENEWKLVALKLGEKLSDNGPGGYYDFTPGEWFEWALNECKTTDEWQPNR